LLERCCADRSQRCDRSVEIGLREPDPALGQASLYLHRRIVDLARFGGSVPGGHHRCLGPSGARECLRDADLRPYLLDLLAHRGRVGRWNLRLQALEVSAERHMRHPDGNVHHIAQ